MIKVNDRQCCKAISSKLRKLSLNSSTIEQSRQWVRFGKPFKQIGFEPVIHTPELLGLVQDDWRALRPMVEWCAERLQT